MASDDPPTPVAARRRRGIKSGIWSFVSAIVLILWVVLFGYITILAVDNEVAAAAVTIMFIVSWVLVPLLAIAVLVFAVIALLLNPVPGKILGALGIVLPFVAAFLLWNWLDVTAFIASL